MVFLHRFVLLFWATGLVHAITSVRPTNINGTVASTTAKNINKGAKGPSNAHRGGNATLGISSHPKHKSTKNQARDLFTRQEVECPPGFPELCPDLLCCEADTVCCADGTCCPDAFPICEPDFCCESGSGACGESCAPVDATCCEATSTYCEGDLPDCCGEGCAPTGATCCDAIGTYCEDEQPLCCGDVQPGHCHAEGTICCSDTDISCPDDELCCGEVAPEYCHPTGTTCCDSEGSYCADDTTCCGDYCCASGADNDKCCPGTENEAVCCGEYATCCDGWCCSEGATCADEFGYCNLPYVQFDYNYIPEIAENMCLGIRTHPPYYSPEEQTLIYVGSDESNYNNGPCRFRPTCCTGVLAPSGNKTQCDEYPFASSEEGGVTAWAACVDAFQNSRQGGILGPFLAPYHAGFQYWVWIINIDCTSVSPSALLPLNSNCLPLLTPVSP